LFFDFYLVYLLLNNCDGNDAKSLLNTLCYRPTFLMLFTQNYQNHSVLSETIACQSWHIF